MDGLKFLEAARPSLVAMFAPSGVVRIEYVVGFVAPLAVSVWLGTATDAERNALAASAPLKAQVQAVLAASGISESDARLFDVGVQSQETVDREYEGSWFYATR